MVRTFRLMLQAKAIMRTAEEKYMTNPSSIAHKFR